nr:uncharacterized protein LOC120098128 [Rattus norvegicus]
MVTCLGGSGSPDTLNQSYHLPLGWFKWSERSTARGPCKGVWKGTDLSKRVQSLGITTRHAATKNNNGKNNPSEQLTILRWPRLVKPGWNPQTGKAGTDPPRRPFPAPTERCLLGRLPSQRPRGVWSEEPALRLGTECTRLRPKRYTVTPAPRAKIQTVRGTCRHAGAEASAQRRRLR